MRAATTLLAAILFAACGNPINLKTASNYYDAAVQAELAGNFSLAEQDYGRALLNAKLGHAADAGISASMYGLGRMKGYLCKFNEAEPLLLESLKLEEGVTGPDSGITTKRLFELARFYFDRGMNAQSLPYFARGIPAVPRLGVESSDPIALADALDEYSVALSKTGNKTEAERMKAQADQIRARNLGKRAAYVPIRYGSKCPAGAA
jgi:hypothetical protein